MADYNEMAQQQQARNQGVGQTPAGTKPMPYRPPRAAFVPSSPLVKRYMGTALTKPQSERGIYIGETDPTYYGSTSTSRTGGLQPQFADRSQQMNYGYQALKGNEADRFAAIAKDRFGSDASTGQLNWLYQQGVLGSSDVSTREGMRATPLDWLQAQMDGEGGGSGGGSGGGGGGGGGGSSSAVNVAVSLTNPESAERLANTALSQYLGRQANKKERGAFLEALNNYEQKNPTITRSASVTGGGSTSSQTSTVGGADQAQFAEDFALAQEGSAEYQASTTYLNAFMGALENPLDVV